MRETFFGSENDDVEQQKMWRLIVVVVYWGDASSLTRSQNIAKLAFTRKNPLYGRRARGRYRGHLPDKPGSTSHNGLLPTAHLITSLTLVEFWSPIQRFNNLITPLGILGIQSIPQEIPLSHSELNDILVSECDIIDGVHCLHMSSNVDINSHIHIHSLSFWHVSPCLPSLTPAGVCVHFDSINSSCDQIFLFPTRRRGRGHTLTCHFCVRISLPPNDCFISLHFEAFLDQKTICDENLTLRLTNLFLAFQKVPKTDQDLSS